MSGCAPGAICGALGGDSRPALDAMLDALADYGPERTAAGVLLGCRHGAGEPALASDAGAGVVLAADARIDDRGSLCDALGVPHPERGRLADADLVLRAFARWGEACPRHLVGDYAFAAWDGRRGALFCARDHIGARPFYYALEGDRFVFASSVEAVLAAPGVSGDLDERMVAAYLSSLRVDHAERTFFRAVRRLPAGHALAVEMKTGGGFGVRVERHWRPEQTPPAAAASDDAHAERFLELCGKAVRDRLRGGPVATHLSGGLDSSSVAALAARELRRQGRPAPLAFSWLPAPDPPPRAEHEREYALIDAVCARERLRVFHGAPAPEVVVDVLRRDGTLEGANFHDEVVLRSASRMGMRVLLSGFGGDQCVSYNGRGHWERLLLRGRWRTLAAELRAWDWPARRSLAHLALSLLHPRLPRTLRMWRSGRSARPPMFIDPGFARRAKPPAPPIPRMIGVRRAQLFFLLNGEIGAALERDRGQAVRWGMEYRYPLLDRRLLEFALGLPPEQFRRVGHGRWLMRHALRRVLPPEVCWNRRKDDPARSEPLVEALAEAWPAVRRQIAGSAPSRARYVDMPALLERLEDGSRLRLGPLFSALHFLDY